MNEEKMKYRQNTTKREIIKIAILTKSGFKNFLTAFQLIYSMIDF
jgi:hypothetical protein